MEHNHEKLALSFALVSGAAWGLGLLTSIWSPIDIGFFIAAYIFGGWFVAQEAWGNVRRGRLDVDALMVLAAIGAALIGKWAEGAVLLFLFSLGHALEERALGRAHRSITALSEIAPQTAVVVRGAALEEVAVDSLQVGDLVSVSPHCRIPADGIVVDGESEVDQSALTGESIPVAKMPNAEVFAGTVNGQGALKVEVSAKAQDSTMARVAELVTQSEGKKSPIQSGLEKFERIYTPAVLILVVAVFLLSAGSRGWADAYYLAMTILVAASPCALAIAVPSAVLAGVARGARAGILFKGGAPLQALGHVEALAFDKTGTLTWGEPRVTSIVEFHPDLTDVVCTMQANSDHPLARAIKRDIGESTEAEAVRARVGLGLEGSLAGARVLVGSRALFEAEAIGLPKRVGAAEKRLVEAGETTMIVWRGGEFLGVIGLMDSPRLEGVEVVRKLRNETLCQAVIISGDRQPVVDVVANAVGADQANGELMPEEKAAHISSLAEQHKVVGMVGDGVNDAPAMAGAQVGIALGASGSAVALETCDVALMNDDLGRIPFAFRLSRATNRIVAQNLTMSIASVVLLVTATLLGLGVGPVVAVHEGITLLVALNSLRLMRFDAGREHDGIEHEVAPGASV